MDELRIVVGTLALSVVLACGGNGDGDDAGAVDSAPNGADAITVTDAAVADASPPDATPPDAGAPDATPLTFALYAIINERLVTIDTATGEPTDIGAVGLVVRRVAFDAATNTVYAIYDNTTAPKLATIDVCTGAATHLVNMTLPGNFVDGFRVYPVDGELYAAVSANGNFPADGSSEQLVTVNKTTGVTTTVADFSGGLLDGDALLLELPQPIAIDGNSATQTIEIFDLDVGTAVASNSRSAGPPRAGRQAVFDGVVYGLGMSGAIAGQILTMDPATGAVTPIGGSHVVAQFTRLFAAAECTQ